MVEFTETTEQKSDAEVAYEPHGLQPVVDLIKEVIESQSYLFIRLTVRETMPDSTFDAKAWDDLYEDRIVAAQASLRVIRLYQDRLLKMSIDMDLDDDLITIKEIKRRPKKGQQTVNDDPQNQDSKE